MLREGLKFGLRSFFVTLKLVCALWVGCCLWWIGNAQAAICFLPDCADKVVEDVKDDSAEKCKAEGYENYQNRVCHQYSIIEFCPYNSNYIKCNNPEWCRINGYIETECEEPYELFDKCPNGEEMYKECKLNMEDACLAEDPTYVSTCKAGWVIDPDDHCSFSDEFGHCCNTCPGFTTKEEIEAAGGTPVASCESCDGTLYIAGADGYNACEGFWDCQDGCAPDAKTCVSNGVTKCDKCKRCEARCTYETCPPNMDCEYEACTWRYCILGCKVGYTYYCKIPEQDCNALGYDKTVEECAGSYLIKCPYDENQVFCMPDDGVCCEPCKDFPYTAQEIPHGYVGGEKCECCGKTLYKKIPDPCVGYSECPWGGAEGAASCLSGEKTLYALCKDCPNACPENPVCPKGTICKKDECSGTYCAIGCENTFTNYCQKPNTNCRLLGYNSISPDCVGMEVMYCPYDPNWVICIPVDEGDCCRNCKVSHPYTEIPDGYIQTGVCECCGKTYYQAEINPCEGFVTDEDCRQGVDETSETCLSGDVIKYASCKNCESDCYLETCPKGSVCSLDDCSGLYCVTGCEVNYTNYCQQPNQDCDALGYYSMKPDCVGLEIIRCPFDTNMVYCFNSK